ncbi:hypothetical protein RHECNPAF_6420034 [Rhizobium etli CNPAF512]|nr:hypothetical protein RHECNPAF_6420034 [Rhizobium etli CNPAF512]
MPRLVSDICANENNYSHMLENSLTTCFPAVNSICTGISS